MYTPTTTPEPSHDHQQAPLPCVRDPLATAGFGTLQRMKPRKARAALLESLPPAPDLASDPTIADLLHGGYRQREMLTRCAALNTVRAHRHTARHLSRVAGSKPVAQIDDAFVAWVGRRLIGHGMAASTRGRVLGLLRGLHRGWAAATGKPCLVAAKPRPRRSMDPAPSVLPMWRLPEVAGLIGATRSPAVRAIVGLVVGGGLHPGEALSLRRDHVRQGLRSVVVRGALGRREVYLPRWASALLQAALQESMAAGSVWAFPSPNYGDLHALELTTGAWTEFHDGSGASGLVPAGRIHSVLRHDAGADRYLLLGGRGDEGARNDLWAFGPEDGSWSRLEAGDERTGVSVGCAGNPTRLPADFVVPDLAAPEPRQYGAGVLLEGQLWSFGGGTDCMAWVDGLWRYSLTDERWSEVLPATTGENCARRGEACDCLCL